MTNTVRTQTSHRGFDHEIVEKLLEIAWWHWDIETISANLKKIVAGDIKELLSSRDNF